jgi:hypothetical protein
MKMKLFPLILLVYSLLCSCASHTSIVSSNDPDWFSEPPCIVTHKNRYFMRWRVADSTMHPFYMLTESSIEMDTLSFFVPGTTSSGCTSGRVYLQEIMGKDEIELAKQGKVAWKEPNGQRSPLKVKSISEVEIQMIPDEKR